MRQGEPNSNKFENQPPFYWPPGAPHPLPQYFPPLHAHRTISHDKFNFPKQKQFQPAVKQEESFVKIQENRHPTFYGMENCLLPHRNERLYQSNNQNQDMFWNYFIHYKKPFTNHKATYFDPSASPLITSELYNHIEDFSRDQKRVENMSQINPKNINEMEFGEHDQSPFITYRFRRIKKKYKKHLSINDSSLYIFENNDQSEKNSESDESSSNSERNQLSQISQKQEKSRKKRRRERRRKVLNNCHFTIENAFSINLSYVLTKNA